MKRSDVVERKFLLKIIKALLKPVDYMSDQYKQQYNKGWNDALKALCEELNIEL